MELAYMLKALGEPMRLKIFQAVLERKHCVRSLSKKLGDNAHELANELCKYFPCDYDEAGSIGKRYRREDEIGTPFCITVDFDTATDGCVTVRDRDTMEQIRIPVSQVAGYINEKINF